MFNLSLKKTNISTDSELIKYYAISISGCKFAAFGHVIFLVYFMILNIKMMMLINVVSILTYSCLIIFHNKLNKKYKYFTLFASVLELALHGFFTVVYIGVSSGFNIYIMAAIPFVIVFPKTELKNKVFFILFSTICFAISYIYSFYNIPIYVVDSRILNISFIINQTSYFLLISIPIYSYFKINEEIKVDYKKLSILDKLKDEFLANTSHELRTPINGIIGISESIIDGTCGKIPDRVKTNINLIISSGKRLSNLINDILDFSKLKNNDLKLNKKIVNLYDIVEVVCTVMSISNTNDFIKIRNEVDRNLIILGDKDRIQQIFYNLIGNAVKFTKQGSIIIESKVEDDFIKVTIEDTGIGIPNDKFEDIFKSFEQIDGSDERDFNGTGLGLSITKKLIEMHSGKIYVQSVLGKGSIFTIVLPKVQMSNYSEIQKTVNEKIENNMSELDSNLELIDYKSSEVSLNENRNSKILIVDDEMINIQVLKNQLNEYNVSVVNNGFDAVYCVEKEMFDLVVLDIMMPKMSGYEVCKRIRTRYSIYELPILLLSAKSQSESIITGLDLGANDYIVKPFSKGELLARIKTLIDLKQSVCNAINSAKTIENERSKRMSAEKLRDLIQNISSSLKLKDVLDNFLISLKDLVYYDIASIILKEENIFKIKAVQFKDDKIIIDKDKLDKNYVIEINDTKYNNEIDFILKLEEIIKSKNIFFSIETLEYIISPIYINKEFNGFILLESLYKDKFGELDRTIFLSVSEQVSITIQNAILFDKVLHMASIDELTQVYNRRHFFQVAYELVENFNSKVKNYCVLMVDIDYFKKFNDLYGHSTGDLVLMRVAGILKKNLRTGIDIIGRYGGEEFAIILPYLNLEVANKIAERIRGKVQEEIIILDNNDKLSCTISIGISKNVKSFTETLKNADRMLYKAKNNGRNRVESFQIQYI